MTTPDSPFEIHERDANIRALAKRSLIFGLLSVCCCGLIFGVLAIDRANKAEAAIILADSTVDYGTVHKTGRTLGYIGVTLWVLGLVYQVFGFLGR